jgi:hypothetical protein
MSISPPSDIILDVVRAADPVREQRAMARLSRMAVAENESFDQVLGAGSEALAAAKTAAPADPRPSIAAPAMPPTTAVSAAEKAFRGFEAMALASMIEAAMPQEGSAVFGSGTAGHVWKSMLAEQLGTQMAEAGGIGIAKQLASGAGFAWSPGNNNVETKTSTLAGSLLVTQVERGFVDDAMTVVGSADKGLNS